MGNLKSYFNFNRQERSGTFYLICLILLTQLGYQLTDYFLWGRTEPEFGVDAVLEERIKALRSRKDTLGLYPFNPNYMTDFKGYMLGIEPKELDRLYEFRRGGRFVLSPGEFQEVTRVSDSLLEAIAPYFRFPELQVRGKAGQSRVYSKNSNTDTEPATSDVLRDLNEATASELRTVRGIGPVLSDRIIRFRDALGGFQSGDQLYDVYGLDSVVATRALKRFGVLQAAAITRININSATASEIGQLLYISAELAEEIVRYREQVGKIVSFDELAQLEGFPSEKIDRIKLYLTL